MSSSGSQFAVRNSQEQFDAARKDIELALSEVGNFDKWHVFRKAFEAGVKAKMYGWFRESPYPDDDQLRTPYWLAGYDGLEFVQPAVRSSQFAVREIRLPAKISTQQPAASGRQSLRRLGYFEILLELKKRYPRASRPQLREAAKRLQKDAWDARDREAIAKLKQPAVRNS